MKFLEQPRYLVEKPVLCNCNKPASVFTDISKRQIRWRCEETYWIAQDIKINKGQAPWPIWDETKHGSPCDFVQVYDLPREPIAKRWRKIVDKLLVCQDPVNIPKDGTKYLDVHPTQGPLSEEHKQRLFVSTLEKLCLRARNRSSWSPMSWEFISKMNTYAEQHLLIPSWQMGGEHKETWEEFLDRFEAAEWVSKNWMIRLSQYKQHEQKPQKRFDAIEKQLVIFEGLPRLKKIVRKNLKRDWKKKEKENLIADKNVEHEAFRKFFKKESASTVSAPAVHEEDMEDFEADADATEQSLDGSGSRDDKDSEDESSQHQDSESENEEDPEGDDDYGLDGDGPDYGDLAGDGFGGDNW